MWFWEKNSQGKGRLNANIKTKALQENLLGWFGQL